MYRLANRPEQGFMSLCWAAAFPCVGPRSVCWTRNKPQPYMAPALHRSRPPLRSCQARKTGPKNCVNSGSFVPFWAIIGRAARAARSREGTRCGTGSGRGGYNSYENLESFRTLSVLLAPSFLLQSFSSYFLKYFCCDPCYQHLRHNLNLRKNFIFLFYVDSRLCSLILPIIHTQAHLQYTVT